MAQVDIGSETYDSFADVDFADVYLEADPRVAATWAALTGRPGLNEKGRLLVTATRILRRQSWRDGVPSYDDTPQPIVEATAEFAGAILSGYDLETPAASVLPVRRQKAGSVEVEYFRDLDNPSYRPPPLPEAVWALIRPFLSGQETGSGWLAGSFSSGTCGSSVTECDGRYEGTRYYGNGVPDRDCN